MVIIELGNLFYIDRLAQLMMGLITFIVGVVYLFSQRYLKGDILYSLFFKRLIALYGSLTIMVCADNIVLFASSWIVSNAILIRLMLHKSSWKASVAAYILARTTFIVGAAAMIVAFIGLYIQTGTLSINRMIMLGSDYTIITYLSLLLLLVTSFTQSALWPFNRWLLSSLNSPTPVSALMHAGVVNAGGFLLVRFAPLYCNLSYLLSFIFLIGLISACLGSIYKLIQTDVKRMFACSTLGQMGFMMMQIGSGLYAAGVAHIIFHGLFKAYLFLSSASVAQEKRLVFYTKKNIISLIAASLVGLVASYCYSYGYGKVWLEYDTSILLDLVAWIAGTQVVLALATVMRKLYYPLIVIVTAIMGGIYGLSVNLIEDLLPSTLTMPQPLTVLHYAAFSIFVVGWLMVNGWLTFIKKFSWYQIFIMRAYVKVLNTSQPHSSTITTCRKEYKHA